ncbi:MAG: phage Gp37/Gp68 family protein [Deltaproteobacteria bacterium]|jgi:protein gp37|nr:phage Gp37/Gp68 family protein [Deltaproteobacteria bacterium]
MTMTKIEWTEKTWNPITGCTKVSPGCENCYAEVMSRRLRAMGREKYSEGFRLVAHEGALGEPSRWAKPSSIFVCSMSDIFHEKVSFEFIDKIMDVINETKRHVYQLLTKRSSRMEEYFSNRPIPSNVWLGVTVECRAAKGRIGHLKGLAAGIRFLSVEPLVEDLGELDLAGIDWVIVGGESGPKGRPMKPEWVRSVQRQAELAKAAFFFKQWGTWGPDGVRRSKKANGELFGGDGVRMRPGHNGPLNGL